MLTPIRVYSSDDLDYILKHLWSDILINGNPLKFGDKTEIKHATEVFAVFQIYGKALQRMYNGDTPKGWKFRNQANSDYVKMLFCSDKGDQPYTYGERLHSQWTSISDSVARHHIEINQLEVHREMLRESIETGIQSNRIWGDIGKPTDLRLKDPACLRGWQLRTSERNKVSARFVMRSGDAGNAVFSNFDSFVRVFVDEVITPAGGILEEVLLVCLSEHIYDHDLDQVEALVGKIPDHMKRMLRKEVRT